jgi:hypothetical protein
LSSSGKEHLFRSLKTKINSAKALVRNNKPGIALTDSNTSAMCCHLLQKDGERREGGNVIPATAFADRSMLLRDLMKESIPQSCNITLVNRIPYDSQKRIIIDFEKINSNHDSLYIYIYIYKDI